MSIVKGKHYEDGKFTEVDIDVTASMEAALWLVDDPTYAEYDRMRVMPACATPEDAARKYAAYYKANDLVPPAHYTIFPLRSTDPISESQLSNCDDGDCWSAFQSDVIDVRL